MGRVLRIIEDIACASNRRTAVEELVSAFSLRFPGASVRAGLGGVRMKRFYDRRLGWLSSTSSLHLAAAERWDDLPSAQVDCHVAEASIIVSLPELGGDGRLVVWIEGKQFTESSLQWLVGGLRTISVVFWERPVRSWLRFVQRLGPGSTFWLAVTFSLLLLIAIWPAHYRIPCTVKVEPVRQRLVATPFEATLLEAKVKPGDSVTAGQVLVVLDGRPLRLELESIESEIQQASTQNNASLATGKIAEAQQAALKVRQLSRRRDLITDRLNRLQVVSPIDGVVVSGELDRFVGSPLTTGQTLVEVAPLDRMAIEIEIPEHEIGYVTPDSETKINITAIGGPSIQASLEDLYPSAEIRDDRNVFIGRIEVDNGDNELRPGMRGKATTYGPLRPLVWSWARGAVEQVVWWLGY
jgi:multidrug resistance efflux pump